MTEKAKVRIVVDEDAALVERLDAIAASEGLSRADLMRRAIRRLVLSTPTVPDFGNFPNENASEVAA